jgi:hypothetical protein
VAKCPETTRAGRECRKPARIEADSDGVHRCTAHSLEPSVRGGDASNRAQAERARKVRALRASGVVIQEPEGNGRRPNKAALEALGDVDERPRALEPDLPDPASLLANATLKTAEGRADFRKNVMRLLAAQVITPREADAFAVLARDAARDKTVDSSRNRPKITMRVVGSKQDADAYIEAREIIEGMA